MPTDIRRSINNVSVSINTWSNISLFEDNQIIGGENHDELGRPSLGNVGDAPFTGMDASTWPNASLFEDNQIVDGDNHDTLGRPSLGNVGDAHFTSWLDSFMRSYMNHK